jgi:hypothetical protein
MKPQAVLFASDLLELDGDDLRARPIEARKSKLMRPLQHAGRQLGEHLHGEGAEVIFRHGCKLGCEGIVSRLAGSRYTSLPTCFNSKKSRKDEGFKRARGLSRAAGTATCAIRLVASSKRASDGGYPTPKIVDCGLISACVMSGPRWQRASGLRAD